MEAYLGEFVGTMVLILFGAGVNAATNLDHALAKGTGGRWIMVTFAWGLGVTFGVYTAGFMGAPGHLNPAVTFGAAIGGTFPWADVVPYIIAQILGAMVGAWIVMIHYYPHFDATAPEDGNSVGIFATGPAIENTTFNFLSEVIATAVFILALNTLGDFTQGLQPFIVGLLIVAIGLSFGSTTGYAINPARDFGPRLAWTIFPVPNKTDANWGYAWIPIVGPMLGAAIGTWISMLVTF